MVERLDVRLSHLALQKPINSHFSSAKQMEGPGKGFKEGSKADINLFDYQARYCYTQRGDIEPSEQVES